MSQAITAPNPQTSYDHVAEEYARRIDDELQHKPFDCQLLAQFVEQVGADGPICDMGCGPGHVARYLQEQGATVLGVDLSPRMVEVARRLNPDIHFQTGNMLTLDVANESWGGIVAFYSIIHIPRTQVEDALRELRRVLKPGGALLLAFHIGTETVHLDEWWDQPVNLDFHFFQPAEIVTALQHVGFVDATVTVRAPYPDIEFPSQRAYILSHK